MTLWPALTFGSIAIALIGYLAVFFTSSVSDPVLRFAAQNIGRYDEELIQLSSIPSISSLPEHGKDIEEAAQWLLARLTTAGLEVIPYYRRSHGITLGEVLHSYWCTNACRMSKFCRLRDSRLCTVNGCTHLKRPQSWFMAIMVSIAELPVL